MSRSPGELGRLSSRWSSRRRGRGRDGCADESVFYSSGHSSIDDGSFHDESFWFASAPGSFGGRYSFGSDLSALSPSPRSSVLHLAGCEPSFVPRMDQDTETRSSSPATTVKISTTKSNPASASKGLDQLLDFVKAEDQQPEDRASSPPIGTNSRNLKDCQNQRVTFESLSSPGGHRRWRPGSLDLNAQDQSMAASSLNSFYSGTGNMKNSCAPSMHSRSNMFPSPGTPNYWHNSVGAASYQKGWSSERVPLPASRGQRYGDNAPLFPFNNGRTLPSKWEDAERWICSPVSGDGSRRPLMLPPYHRRPKSKSGPLGAPTLNCESYTSASPQVPCFDDGRVVNFTGSSPFLAGVLVTDRQFCGITGGGRTGQEGCNGGQLLCTSNSDAHINRSASMLGWLDTLVEPSTSLPTADGVFRGYRIDSAQEIAAMMSPMALSRDVGTQMSPEESTHSSPKEKHSSFSQSPLPVHTITEFKSNFPCIEIRDVQVDDRVTVTRWSKKHISRCSDRRSTDIIEWKRKTVDSRTSDWEVVDAEKCISKYDKEEAKITAWENLQKAKAEASLQKLEMKLEKKRSTSMEKILNRLKSAQRKAQDMRSSVVDTQVCMVPRTGQRVSYFRKYGRMSSFRGCFACHAF